MRDHTELSVWQLADAVRREVRSITGRASFARHPGLRDQLRRAAESPCANIAEGFARYLPRDFARFPRIAKGSLAELGEHLDAAQALELVTERETASITTLSRRCRGACTRLIVYLQSATPPTLPRT